MNFSTAHQSYLDTMTGGNWSSEEELRMEREILCQVGGANHCVISTHFCKNGCGPICQKCADAATCKDFVCHDVCSIDVAEQTGLFKKEDYGL